MRKRSLPDMQSIFSKIHLKSSVLKQQWVKGKIMTYPEKFYNQLQNIMEILKTVFNNPLSPYTML